MTIKEATLLKTEEELRALDSKYKVLQEKVTELKAIYETVSDAVISAIEKENEQMEADIKKGQHRKETVAGENKKFRELLSEVERANTEVDDEQRRIKTNITAIIEKHHDEIEAMQHLKN